MKINKYQNLSIDARYKHWIANPIKGNVTISIPGIDKFMMYSDIDDGVLKNLYWTDFMGWEYSTLLIWDLLTNCYSGLVLDIGTYSGIYSLIASKNYKNQVLAFDIQKTCVKRVMQNVELNKFDNIKTFQSGLGSKNEEKIYFRNDDYNFMTPIASFKKHKRHNKKSKVKVICGDDIVFENSEYPPIENMKIDVEGGELEVVKGLNKTIIEFEPNIIIEILDFKNLHNLYKLLPSGYEIFEIDDYQIKLFKPKNFRIPFQRKNRNFLCTTRYPMIKKLVSNHNLPLKL